MISTEDVPVDKYHKKQLQYFHDVATNINSGERSTRYGIPCTKTASNQNYEGTKNSYLGSNYMRRFVLLINIGSINGL